MLPRLGLNKLPQMILWLQPPEVLDHKLDKTTSMCHHDDWASSQVPLKLSWRYRAWHFQHKQQQNSENEE